LRAERERFRDCLRILWAAGKTPLNLTERTLKNLVSSAVRGEISEEEFTDKIGEILPSSISPEVASAFLLCLQKEFSRSKRALSFSNLIFMGKRERDLAAKLSMAKKYPRAKEKFLNFLGKAQPLEEEDFWAMLAISLQVNTHLTFEGLGYALARLRWKDVNLKEGTLFFHRENWRREFPLKVWIDPVSKLILGAWRRKKRRNTSPEDLVFPGIFSLSSSSLNYHLKRWVREIYGKETRWRELKNSSRLYAGLIYSSDIISYLAGRLYSPPSPTIEVEPERFGEEVGTRRIKKRFLPIPLKKVEEWEEILKEEMEKTGELPADVVDFLNGLYRRVLKQVVLLFPKPLGPQKRKILEKTMEGFRGEVLRASLPEEVRKNALHLVDFAEYCLRTKWKEGTVRAYLSHLINIPAEFWFSDFADMDEEDLQEIFTIFRTLTPLKNFKPAIKAFFSFLEKEKGLAVNINWRKLRSSREAVVPEHFITWREYFSILEDIEKEREQLRKEGREIPRRSMLLNLAFSVVLGYRAGMRISEITNLRLKDIWFEGDSMWIYIDKGKSRSARRRLRIGGLVGLEKEIVETMKSNIYFLRKRGLADREDKLVKKLMRQERRFIALPVSPSEISREFSKRCEDLGLGSLRFHLLRHGFASRMRAKGETIMNIVKAMGHLLPEVTFNHYINNLDLIQRKQLEKFWKENPLLRRVKPTTLLRFLSIPRGSFYLWARNHREKPSLSSLESFLAEG